MKLILPGGSGHVGTLLSHAFQRDGHDVVVLSRRPVASSWRTVAWDGETLGPWVKELEAADVLINLAGRSVNCRYHDANRREIMHSRVKSTDVLGAAVRQLDRPPRVWLQANTATIYAHRYDAANDEATGIIGGTEPNVPETWRFSIDVATKWEHAFNINAVERAGVRKVAMRSAIIMSPERAGPFDLLLGLVRRCLGGTAGDGRQFVSWIHGDDFVRVVYWLIERSDISGIVNIAAPHPLPNRDFMRGLREAWGIKLGMPAPAWLLEIGVVFMRSETELVLKSRRVVPARLLAEGFSFRWSEWAAAARDLCGWWRKEQ